MRFFIQKFFATSWVLAVLASVYGVGITVMPNAPVEEIIDVEQEPSYRAMRKSSAKNESLLRSLHASNLVERTPASQAQFNSAHQEEIPVEDEKISASSEIPFQNDNNYNLPSPRNSSQQNGRNDGQNSSDKNNLTDSASAADSRNSGSMTFGNQPASNTPASSASSSTTTTTDGGSAGSTSYSFSWPFSIGTAADYTTSNASVEITSGVARLMASDQVDDDNDALGFLNGTSSGMTWDSSNELLRLDQTGTPLNHSELDASWTPLFSTIVGYWKMDFDWNDSAGTNDGTPLGGATFSASSKIGSYAGSFDGVNDMVQVTDINLGTQHTIMFWMVFNDAGDAVVIGRAGWHYSPYVNSGAAAGYFQYCANNVCTNSTAHGGLENNKWYHVAMVRNGTSVSFYKDGYFMNTGTLASNETYLFSTMGARSDGSYHLLGSLDEVIVWPTPLTYQQLQTVYFRQAPRFSGTFTSRVMDAWSVGASWSTFGWVPTLPFYKELSDAACAGATCTHANSETSTDYASLIGSTAILEDPSDTNDDIMKGIVGLWHLNESAVTAGVFNDFKDDSGEGNHGEQVGTLTFAENGKLGKAVKFNGGANFIKMAYNASLNNVTAGTISAWVRTNSIATQSIFSTWGGGSTGIQLYLNAGRASLWSNSTTTTDNVLINDGKWHHLVASFSGTFAYLYVDGILKRTLAMSGVVSLNESQIGTQCSGANSTVCSLYVNGHLDEVGLWNRLLDPKEIVQLYRRGANRIQYQVRTCAADPCNDLTETWKGPDGTEQTYFSELNNNSIEDGTGDVQKTIPSLLFSSFATPAAANRHFQYRAIMEADDTGNSCDYGSGATWCSPELKSVSVDPVHYDSTSPTVYGNTGQSIGTLSALNETLGPSGCSGGVGYNLSPDQTNWYWWTGTAWGLANGTVAKSNAQSVMTANASSLSTIKNGKVFFKAFLTSTGTAACELDDVQIKW